MQSQPREINTKSDIHTSQTRDSSNNSRIISEKISEESQRIRKARGEISDDEKIQQIKEDLVRRATYPDFFNTVQKIANYMSRENQTYIEAYQQLFYNPESKKYDFKFDNDKYTEQKNAIANEYITAARNGTKLQPLKGPASEVVITLIKDYAERTSTNSTEQEVAEKAISLVQGTEQKKDIPSAAVSPQPGETAPFKGKGREHAESGPSQDTSDIAQKQHRFFYTLRKETINGLRHTSSFKGKNSSEAYNRSIATITKLCDKIIVKRQFATRKTSNLKQYEEITEKEAINAAIQLKTTLDSFSVRENTSIDKLRKQVNQCYQDAGLS